MRTNRETKRKAIQKIAGLMVLVLCFALTFTLVLTLGVNSDLHLDNPTLAPVADAAEIAGPDNSSTNWGTAAPISVASFANVTGADIMKESNSTSWTYNVNLNSVAPAGSSSPTNFQIWKDGGNNNLYTQTGTANHWEFGATKVMSGRNFGISLAYKLPDFIYTLVNNDNFTVEATVSFTYVGRYSGSGDGNIDKNIYASSSSCNSGTVPAANTYWDKKGSAIYSSANTGSANANLSCSKITLSKGNDCVAFGVAFSAGTGVNTKRGIIFKNIAIKFDITLGTATTTTSTTSINDYSAPVKVSTLNGKDTSTYESYTPFITDVTKMPVYYKEIEARLASYTDQKNSATRTVLRSFTSQERTATVGSGNTAITYYKHSSAEYADTYDYSTAGFSEDKLNTAYSYYAGVGGYILGSGGSLIASTTGTGLRLVSGIKSVTITVGSGDTAFTTTIAVNSLSNSAKSASVALKATKSSSTTIGYAVVTKTNKARIKVDIYMSQNATVGTQVTDNGDRSSVTYTTDFQGIDSTRPSVSSSLSYDSAVAGANSYITTNYTTGLTNASWFRDNVFSPTISISKSSSDSGAPFIFFYTVQRSDNPSDLSTAPNIEGYGNWRYSSSKDFSTGSHNLIKTLNMKPIGYDTLTSFDYNFATGAAKAMGDAANTYTATNPSIITDDVTGAGYYRFIFYTVDIAGNLVSSPISRYVKVDYDDPSYEVDFSYIKPGTQDKVTISPADNGKWATGRTTFKITFDKLNFSGNTLIINGKDETTYSIAFDKDKITAVNGVSVNTGDTINNETTFTLKSRIDDTSVRIVYTVEQWTDTNGRTRYRGVLTFTFDDEVVGTYPTVAIESPFNTYPGLFLTELAASENIDAAKHLFTNASWNGGIKLYIDRNAPVTPTLGGNEYIVNGLNNYSISNLPIRKWMTDGYSVNAKLDFYDDLWNTDSEYAKDIIVYLGFKYIRTQADLDAYKNLNMEELYKDIIQSSQFSGVLYDRSVTDLQKNDTDFPIDFEAANGSGMRIMYLWVRDQAGNVSQLSTYYILIDNKDYNISSNIFNNPIIGQQGTTSITNASGSTIETAKRGDAININFTLDAGFVPYTVTKNGTRILENYTPNHALTKVADGPFNDLLAISVDRDTRKYTVTFTVDDLDILSEMEDATNFEIALRQVITRSFTSSNLQKAYDATPIDMPTYLILNAEAAMSHYKFDFSSVADGGEETPLDAAPVDKGSYFVYVYIERDDDTYIDSTYIEQDGVQTKRKVGFTIREGRVVVTITSTGSIYGDNLVLNFNISGFNKENTEDNPAATGEYWKGSLTILDTNGNKLSQNQLAGLISVGSYDIVTDVAFSICDRNGQPSANYAAVEITDNSPKHTISQRNINIMAWEAHQAYANPTQTAINFGVDTTASLYSWYTQKGAGYTVDRLMSTVFAGYTDRGNGTFNGANYKLFNSNGNITRVAGNRVGRYAYNRPLQFEVDNNFYVTIDVTSQFYFIDKREVVLDTSANTTQIFENETFDPTTVIPTYALASIDQNLGIDEEVANAVRGLLSLGTDRTEGSSEDYVAVYIYAILLGRVDDNNQIETDNLIIKLGENAVYIVNVAGGDTILVNVNDGAIFAVIFGQTWTSDLITYNKYKNNFTVTGIDEGEFDDISWNFSIANASFGDYISVGNHQVTFTDVKLLKNGEEVNARVMVGRVNLTVTPAEVVVRPYADRNTKTYGDADSVFGIKYQIVSVNGTPLGTNDLYAGYTYQEIAAAISGAFARGVYSQNGYMYPGLTYDNATDENGVVLFGEAHHYGFCVSTEFEIADDSFTVKTDIPADARFIIEQKAINLNVNNFVGIGKSYDGEDTVNYGNGTAYSLSSELVQPLDDVKLKYTAKYTNSGSSSTPTEVGIIFTNLALDGAAKLNYKLGTIINGNSASENKLFDGTNIVSSANISNNVSVIIYYIDNNTAIDKIIITMGSIAILKEDFAITKRYDNTDKLDISNIIVNLRNDEFGGSKLLYQIWSNKNVRITTTNPTFGGTEVGSRYQVNITLLFLLEGATESGITVKRDGIYQDSEVTISVEEGVGIKVELDNMVASIEQRVLGVKDFETITPVDQDYSSLKRITDTEFTLASDALAVGDSISSVGVNLVSLIDGDDYGFGKHNVMFAQMGDGDDMSSVDDSNYSIDINALNEFYKDKISVYINKAKLYPNVKFNDQDYSGDYKVEDVVTNRGNALTTLRYSTYLSNELAKFSIAQSVTYQLSAKGELNANVMVDENHNAVMHNVMIGGLTIVEDGTENLLRNYEIYGMRYDSSKKEYVAVGAIKSGAEIADYEMIDAIKVNKKELQILTNNVVIKEKVYDGTTVADIHVSLEDSGIAENDLQSGNLFVDAYGKFTRGIVSTNVPVSISGVELQAKEGFAYLLDNYILRPYSERRTANIVLRPVAINEDQVNLGEKTYNGTIDIAKKSVSIGTTGILPNEQAGYGIQPGAAYFFDKNVKVAKDTDGNVIEILAKSGVVYNPVLTNTRGQVNYSLAMATTEKNGEDYIAYVDENGTLRYGEKYDGTGSVTYYYALPTTSKYIPASASVKEDTKGVIGSYMLNGTMVYTVDDTYEGTDALDLPSPLTYVKGYGKILQKSISISTEAIIINPDSKAFTKLYDGTQKFYGVRGTAIDNGDYYYDNTIGIRGLVGNDIVVIEDIDGKFDTASTAANSVIFTIKKISGADADNYSIYGGISSARRSGNITKRTIDATLNSGEMIYGTSLNTIKGDVTYQVHGNNDKKYELILWENGFYLPFNTYIEMMGSPLGSYQDALRTRMFLKNLKDGFDPIDENDDLKGDLTDYYVKLSGITSLPTINIEFSTAFPSAGEISRAYTLNNVVVSNYEFNPIYKNLKGEIAKTSELKVIKRDLFVSTDGSDINKDYAGTDPVVELSYYNAEGKLGFAPSETVVTVFRIDGRDYYPIVKWIVLNKKTGKWSYMDKYAVISDDLADDLVYMAHIEAAEYKDENGNTVVADYSKLIKNYNIHLGNDYVANEDGTITLTYNGFDYTSTASKLMLNQPKMSSVYLRDTANNTYTETYSGKNNVASLLLGVMDGDIITIEGEEGQELNPVDAGTYVGKIHVKRPVRIDANDPNTGYFNTWESKELVTIVINQASPQLKVVSTSKTYDNIEFAYGVSGVNNMISSLRGLIIRDGDVTISYEKQVGQGYEHAEKLLDAGIYRVTVQLNDNFATKNPNYLAEKAVATFTILRAEVNVTISTEGYKAGNINGVLSLGAEYKEDAKYPINYDIAMASGASADIALPKGQTSIAFEKDIVSAGRYPFAVVINEGELDRNNYRLVGANGVLELTTDTVTNATGTLKVEEQIVANRFVSKEIVENRGNGSDLELWTKVNEYMPHIDSNAKLAAVVRLGLYYDNVAVDLNGASMTVSVDVPKNVGDMEGKAIYTVTKNGGLARLENYTIKDGKLEYTTDFLGAIVFVDLTPNTLALWQIIVIAVAVGFVAIALIWTVIALVVRKSQLKKLI